MLNEPKTWVNKETQDADPQLGRSEVGFDAPENTQQNDSEASASRYSTSQKHELITVNDTDWIFGINWRVLTDQKEARNELRLARLEGATDYCLTETRTVIGLVYGLSPETKTKCFSAALHIAENISHGKLEIYIFEIKSGLFCLIGINEMRPLPHFDVVGDEETITYYFNEFKALHPGQTIRTIGDTKFIDLEETTSITEVFVAPSNYSKLKIIRNYNLIIKIAAIGSLILAGITFASYKIHEQYLATIASTKQAPPDINQIYKVQLLDAFLTVGRPAQMVFDKWLQVIRQIPLTHRGWKLVRVECADLNCTATWMRSYGSYEDFATEALPGVEKIKRSQLGNSPSDALIYTDHPVSFQPSERVTNCLSDPLTLPSSDASLAKLGSYLQDLSLVQGMKTQLIQPKLFPSDAEGTVDSLNMPVVRGEWQITHDLWSIGQLKLGNDTTTLNKLIVTIITPKVEADIPKPANTQDSELLPLTYQIKGYYYAKYKELPNNINPPDVCEL